MVVSFHRLHWLRFLGAILAMALATAYLLEFEGYALIGFTLLGALLCFGGIRLHRGTLQARCDLCDSAATMKAEYGAGFSGARLILNCPRCGRVVNAGSATPFPRKES